MGTAISPLSTMFKFVVVAACLSIAAAVPLVGDSAEPVVSDEMINKINSNMSTWWAGRNEHFEGWTWDEARRLFGTRMVNPEGVNMPVRSHDDIDMNDIPASFDARQQWPQYIHPIRDQARCGSCWAFAASEVLSDRFAIQSSGSVNVVLSPEDLVSCDQSDMGCQGGYLANAWKYLSDSGIVTDKCFPYGAQAGTPPQCVSKCEDGEAWKKYKAKNAAQITGVDNIKKEIYTNGPVEAGFNVYKSFMSYKSGVYQHHWWAIWDSLEGGHAIKILGWGQENGEDYWLCANSWTTAWGEDGFFKIKQGNSGIESQVFAGVADV